jgi:hypothetical protein
MARHMSEWKHREVMAKDQRFQELKAALEKAATAEEIAEICRQEAELLGGPFFQEGDKS